MKITATNLDDVRHILMLNIVPTNITCIHHLVKQPELCNLGLQQSRAPQYIYIYIYIYIYPAIPLSNVRSIRNKMDELSTVIMHDSDYRRSSLLCLTETWLSEQTTAVGLGGYTTIRFDRNKTKTDKNIVGGLV